MLQAEHNIKSILQSLGNFHPPSKSLLLSSSVLNKTTCLKQMEGFDSLEEQDQFYLVFWFLFFCGVLGGRGNLSGFNEKMLTQGAFF